MIRGGRLALDCRELVVNYGTFTAVDHVSIQVEEGEILGLLGPNGAGKTSVIRALTTIVPAAAGSATIGGIDLSDAVGVRSCIGVLPESNGYPASQTAHSYLRFHGCLFGLADEEAAQRADHLLTLLGLGNNYGRIATFSRGMRQRLGLCRALINNPVVLFLDEPTLGLDPAGQDEIMTHLARTAAERRTSIVLCSHLLDEVERVCDRVAIMDHGKIIADGTVDHVISGSGVAGRGQLRVSLDDIDAAVSALQDSPAAKWLNLNNSRRGDIEIELSSDSGARRTILTRLLDAGIEPRSFDLQGARLSDAFLALTGSERGTLS